ncbi:hypothetical protein WJ03_10115 [Burkholderia vietnamiensis]|nr:hypothetical protein WJ03_10115 [Burkholderia vietnamiensis]
MPLEQPCGKRSAEGLTDFQKISGEQVVRGLAGTGKAQVAQACAVVRPTLLDPSASMPST